MSGRTEGGLVERKLIRSLHVGDGSSPSSPRNQSSAYSPGPLQATICSFVYVVQSGIEIETGHSGLSDGSAAAFSLALPSSVALSQSCGSTSTVCCAGFLPSRICKASVTPAPPIEPGLVTAAPTRPLTELSWPTKPALSAPTTGTSGACDSTSASTMTLSMPEVHTPLNGVPVARNDSICCLAWSCCQ